MPDGRHQQRDEHYGHDDHQQSCDPRTCHEEHRGQHACHRGQPTEQLGGLEPERMALHLVKRHPHPTTGAKACICGEIPAASATGEKASGFGHWARLPSARASDALPSPPATQICDGVRRVLAIYLNDHLAASTAARELARRAAGSNRGSEYGPFLERLAAEIDEDRESLFEIMRALGVGVDRLKVVAGWGGEKLGRLKLNGRLLGYSPLSRVVELEALALGVNGKLGLWRALRELGPREPRLARFDFDELIARGERQLGGLESQRLRAAAEAFG